MHLSIEPTEIFYGIVAAIVIGVIVVLWRNYRAWRAWKNDYEKQGDFFKISSAPLSSTVTTPVAARSEETFR